MRKTQWQKSGNGPDWTDVEAAIRAIDGVHQGKTGLLISALGTGGTGGLSLVITTVWDSLSAPVGITSVESQSEWPCSDCSDLAAHILGGIYRHDYAIGEAYQQRSFKEV